jgi:hypothetical protein
MAAGWLDARIPRAQDPDRVDLPGANPGRGEVSAKTNNPIAKQGHDAGRTRPMGVLQVFPLKDTLVGRNVSLPQMPQEPCHLGQKLGRKGPQVKIGSRHGRGKGAH